MRQSLAAAFVVLAASGAITALAGIVSHAHARRSSLEMGHATGTNLLEVPAIVVDGRGDPVTGLNRDDFAVAEDGVSVPIESFSEFDADSATEVDRGRFIILVLDDMAPPLLSRIKQVAAMFADRMSGFDVAAVLGLGVGHAVTTVSGRQVKRQIGEIKPLGARAPAPLWLEPSDSCAECGNIRPPGAALGSEAIGGTRQRPMVTIADLARQLTNIKHRLKTVVCIGPAGLFDVNVSVRSAQYGAWLTTIHEAAEANLAIDVVDVPGSTRNRSRGLATETGGHVFEDRDASKVVEKIWAATGHYYLIAYRPPAADVHRNVIPRPGSHDIEIRVKRSGATVWARKTRA